MNQPAIKEEILRSYIDQIFMRYDTTKVNTLNPTETNAFFNDLFKSLNIPITMTPQQTVDIIKTVNSNYNGNISKEELFTTFKSLLNFTNAPQPQPQPIQAFGSYMPMMANPTYINMNMNMNNNYQAAMLQQQQNQNYMMQMRQNQQNYPANYQAFGQNGNQFNNFRR